MARWSDGLGRTIIIAGVAGTLFAGFLALAPRLTAADSTAAPTTTIPAIEAAGTSLPGISDPVVAVPQEPANVQVTVTTEPPTTTTTTVAEPTVEDGTTTRVAEPDDPAFDGRIMLTVEARNAGDAHPHGVLVEGDEIQWRFTLTNTSDEELWGAYVYLELHGPASCDEHNLEPGDATDCWIATTAVEGSHTAVAWATAWTLDEIVKDEIQYTFTVTL